MLPLFQIFYFKIFHRDNLAVVDKTFLAAEYKFCAMYKAKFKDETG